MKQLYLFANWKMYLNHEESLALAQELKKQVPGLGLQATLAVFPSSLPLLAVREVLDGVASVGAQNVYWVDKGGYTGEISAAMYKQAGCSYALVGHSERRHVFNETNHDVRQKYEAALTAELTPVLCVGETLQERKDDKIEEVIEAQLRAAFTDLVWSGDRELIIAYEPVWAISTGESCDPDEAERVADLISRYVRGLIGDVTPVVLYGGSVRPDNVAQYVAQEHIQGVLVGGASTKLPSWMDILNNVKS